MLGGWDIFANETTCNTKLEGHTAIHKDTILYTATPKSKKTRKETKQTTEPVAEAQIPPSSYIYTFFSTDFSQHNCTFSSTPPCIYCNEHFVLSSDTPQKRTPNYKRKLPYVGVKSVFKASLHRNIPPFSLNN